MPIRRSEFPLPLLTGPRRSLQVSWPPELFLDLTLNRQSSVWGAGKITQSVKSLLMQPQPRGWAPALPKGAEDLNLGPHT